MDSYYFLIDWLYFLHHLLRIEKRQTSLKVTTVGLPTYIMKPHTRWMLDSINL